MSRYLDNSTFSNQHLSYMFFLKVVKKPYIYRNKVSFFFWSNNNSINLKFQPLLEEEIQSRKAQLAILQPTENTKDTCESSKDKIRDRIANKIQ